MTNVPAAFLSYSRFDDEHDKGRISTIRERLSGEVRAQTGEQFEIFQDRQDIAWGQQWKRRIADSLDAVTFLIPILTPSFFKSEACRGELERFLDRETKLARDDLILPVLYIDCPVLNDKSMRDNDPLASVLAARQHSDWRELRFEEIDSPTVKKMFALMAEQIREAIDRTNSKTNVADTPAVRDVTSVSEASETSTVKKHADDRLNTVIDFGSSLSEIAEGFMARMDEFNSLDGGGPDKFRDLAAHVYSCVAASLDRYLTRTRMSPENRAYVGQVSQRLKQLADYGSNYRNSPFSKYWDDGTQIAGELLAHVRHLERLTT
jgi:hypothetical protein